MYDPGLWAVWGYRVTIVNDGSNSGSHIYSVRPTQGSVAILLGGELLNGDTSTRTASAFLLSPGASAIRRALFAQSVVAGAIRQFPTTELTGDNGDGSASSPFVVASGQRFDVTIAAVAVSQNTACILQFLIHGTPPTVILTSPTDAVEVVVEDRVF